MSAIKLTHKGWFGFLPVYFSFGSDFYVISRFDALEFMVPVMARLFNCTFALGYKLFPDAEFKFHFSLVSKLKQPIYKVQHD